MRISDCSSDVCSSDLSAHCFPLFSLQRATVKDRSSQSGENIEAAERAAQHIAGIGSALFQRRAEPDVEVEPGLRNADRSGSGLEIGLCLKDVRTLVDERGR